MPLLIVQLIEIAKPLQPGMMQGLTGKRARL